MFSLSVPRAGFKSDFSVIADSFLHASGLPFASVFHAEAIERVFPEEESLFGQGDIFSTPIVLWAFLAQTLRDGKGVACSSAVVHRKQPRHLSFTLACQSLLACWMVLATGSCRDRRALYNLLLAHLAAHEVANRPGRIEPRVLKRRRHRYPLMQQPRVRLREELMKT